MKKILITLLVFAATITAQSQDLKWETDVNKASKEAIKTKKPLLLFFTGSDWCGWCIRLQKEVLKTPEFAKWASQNVILVDLDFPRNSPQSPELKAQNNALQQTFQVQGFPTVWFAKPSIDKKTKKTAFAGLGSTGYVAGGPSAWLATADKILKNK